MAFKHQYHNEDGNELLTVQCRHIMRPSASPYLWRLEL